MIKIFDSAYADMKDILYRGDNNMSDSVEGIVDGILAEVKVLGDDALRAYTEKFDKVKLDVLEVSEAEIKAAYNKVSPEVIQIMKEARDNIAAFHKKQLREGFEIKDGDKVIGQRFTPIESAGVYVPGGTASYPSSVLMNILPAKIAGVKNIIMVTPPDKDGNISSVILAAADIAGATRIFKIGGAQAIAALAYGTESVPKVDKITGPGNVFVATAKRKVFGLVSIDMVAGPSEILVIADKTANASIVAADMLSQAEHDRLATAVLITTSEPLARKTAEEIERRLRLLPREEIARASIESNGKIIIVSSIEEAVDISNKLAPEHLELAVEKPFDVLKLIKNAGSIFLGHNCPEALGDYFAGPNHILPTSGTASFSSPLSVDDFVKKSSYIYYGRDDLKIVEKKVALFARTEGLEAHAKSVESRFENE